MERSNTLDLTLKPVDAGTQVSLPEFAAGSSSCSCAAKTVQAATK